MQSLIPIDEIALEYITEKEHKFAILVLNEVYQANIRRITKGITSTVEELADKYLEEAILHIKGNEIDYFYQEVSFGLRFVLSNSITLYFR